MLVLLLLACDGASPSACDTLSPEACAATEGCAAIDGGELAPPGVLDTGVTCWTEVGAATVGCRAADAACPAEERFAANPDDGSCWSFVEGCVPAGWGACEDEPPEVCP